jgi:hypothetical protein
LEGREVAYLRRDARQLVAVEMQRLERREVTYLRRDARQLVVVEI